jgi:hypothetical protein
MYGKTCLAVDLGEDQTLGDFIADVIEGVAPVATGHELSEVAEAFRGMKTDSMGRGIVVYFPGVPYASEDSEVDPAQAEADDPDELPE